jgi:hypothetical protein
MKATTQTAAKAANKAAKNTPIAKAAAKALETAPKAASVSPKAEVSPKVETAPKALFALVAGTIMAMPKFLGSAISNHRAHGRFSGTDKAAILTQAGAVWFANREGREWGSKASDIEYTEGLKGAGYTVKEHSGVQWPMKANGMPYPVGSGFIGRMAFFRVLAMASNKKA